MPPLSRTTIILVSLEPCHLLLRERNTKEDTNDHQRPQDHVLSAGTVHRPNFINRAGWPILEATSEAQYLLEVSQERGMPIPGAHILRECTSLDTIGNAYFTRTTHTELAGYRRLHVITSAFHMARTRAIFDFVFSLPWSTAGGSSSSTPAAVLEYELSYETTSDGEQLTAEEEDAMVGRRARERSSLIGFFHTLHRVFGVGPLIPPPPTIKTAGGEEPSSIISDDVLAAALADVAGRTKQSTATLRDLHRFLFEEHSAYKTHKEMIVVNGNVDAKTLNSY